MDVALSLAQQHLRVSVIIPARNEAPNLQYVLPHLPAFVHEVILVDGHSADNTSSVAQSLLPNVHIVEQIGEGKGDAIRQGIEASTGDIIVLLDADGSADPLEISRFVEVLLLGADFAKGSRFLKGGKSHDITLIRRLGNNALISLVNILFGTRYSDLCYGYNVFWRHCLDYVAIDGKGFEIETLINLRMHLAGLNIKEVPSIEYQRIHGISNLHAIRDGWRILKLILRERRKKKQQVVVPIVRPQLVSVTQPQPQPIPEEVRS